MIYLNGKYYVVVNDERYRIHPIQNIILRLRVNLEKNQKVIRNQNNELEFKRYPETKKIME